MCKTLAEDGWLGLEIKEKGLQFPVGSHKDLIGDGSVLLSKCKPGPSSGAPRASIGVRATCEVTVTKAGSEASQDKNKQVIEGDVGLNLCQRIAKEYGIVLAHGIDLGVQALRKGEAAIIEITLPSTQYTVLLQVLEAKTQSSRPWDLSPDNRLAIAQAYKETATQLVGEQMWQYASQRYGRAIQNCIHARTLISTLPGSRGANNSPTQEHAPSPPLGSKDGGTASGACTITIEDVEKILLACYLNLALCHLKLGDRQKGDWKMCYKLAIDSASKALQYDPNSTKGLYRRALGHRGCGRHENCLDDLQTAAKISPSDKSVARELEATKAVLDAKMKPMKDGLQDFFSPKKMDS